MMTMLGTIIGGYIVRVRSVRKRVVCFPIPGVVHLCRLLSLTCRGWSHTKFCISASMRLNPCIEFVWQCSCSLSAVERVITGALQMHMAEWKMRFPSQQCCLITSQVLGKNPSTEVLFRGQSSLHPVHRWSPSLLCGQLNPRVGRVLTPF